MSHSVLVTGISGFIAKHVALALLRGGHRVRGTVRSLSRGDEVRAAMAAQGADTSRLEFTEADLTSGAGWTEAMEGCTHVQHIASPFPMEQPRDREALVPAARDGALRVMRAAKDAGARRIVVTSSMVAMMYRPGRPKAMTVNEDDWSDVNWDKLSAYQVSKTRAERAVWDWAKDVGWTDRVTVVNPGFVLGPALDARTGTSLDVVKLIMDGAYPAVPPVTFPIVDVRDLADLHVRAMEADGVGGRRLIGAGGTCSMKEMARFIKSAYPEKAKKAPTRQLPAFVVRIASNFDRSLKSVITDMGVVPTPNSNYVTELTGVTFRPAEETVRDAAGSLIEFGLV